MFNSWRTPDFAPQQQQVIDPRAEYERQSKLAETLMQQATNYGGGGWGEALAMMINAYGARKAGERAEGSLSRALELEQQQEQEALAAAQAEAERKRQQEFEDFQRRRQYENQNQPPTALERELLAANIDPRSPQGQEIIARGRGTTVNVAPQGQQGPRIGTIPPGYEAVTDPQTGATSFRLIPGGPAEAEQNQLAEKSDMREQRTDVTQGVMRDEINRALEVIEGNPGLAAGPLSVVGQFFNVGPANRLDSALEGLKPNIAFDRLDQMRQSSPTGGAVGQLTDKEREALASVFGSLRQSQHPEDLQYNLRRLNNLLIDGQHGTPEQRAELVRSGRIPPELNQQINALYMPLEQRQQSGSDIDDLLRKYGG